MSIDMSQFYQVFFEETQEHLTSMESLLLELDIDDPDSEQLNAIFRAAHSIKGSSGTFGFTDLAAVTHILENLLDRIRKGELTLKSEMIDAFLDAGDVLKILLGAHRGEGAADPAEVTAICDRLKQLTSDSAPAAIHVQATDSAPSSSTQEMVGEEIEVSFILDMEPEEAATTVENLVAELALHWPVRVTQRSDETTLPWKLALAAGADQEMVRGMLEFVARSDSIRMGRGGDSTAAMAGDTEDAYGFFGDDESAARAAPAVDESYGFFDELPATTPSASAADESYGFFTDLPALAAASAPVPALAVMAEPTNPAAPTVTAGTEGDGFGFFVDVPAPVPEAPAVAAVATTEGASGRDDAKKPVREAKKATAGAAAETSIRVGVDKVDQLINLIGELVITQAMLTQSAQGVDPVAYERLFNGLGQLERNTRDLQESVMSIRMMPMSVVFSRFPRVIRDLSQKLGKQVELKTSGEATELDKGLIERITDPLTHLIRNSLDHGIEMPEERIAKGKPAVGTITLKAYHQSGYIVIEVGDDGAGLNRQRILSKAKERGLPVNDSMSDPEVWLLIFEAGFSTAEQVTEVSGRGVGMDVVKRNIYAMGGRVEIESMTGVGTRMTVRLPLTLAILDGMSVSAGEYLPVIALYELFKIPGTITRLHEGIMVIIEADGIKAALFIDALVGQHQVVIKSLEANYRKVVGVSGATIMGDGHVALILDVIALVQMAKSTLSHLPNLPRAA